jgi:putative membrane protein
MVRKPYLLATASAFLLISCGERDGSQMVNTGSAGNGAAMTSNALEGPSIKAGNVSGDLKNAAPVTPSAQDFANTAAASDNFEIETSKLAQTNGQSAAIKAFAQKMIDAHTASTAKLKKAAGSVAPTVVPDMTLAPDQQQSLDQLRSKRGKDFDQTYANLQVDAHQRTLDALKNYAAKGDQPPLNAFANEIIPIVAEHLTMARNLKP